MNLQNCSTGLLLWCTRLLESLKSKALSVCEALWWKKNIACVIIGEKTVLQPNTSLQTEIKMIILPGVHVNIPEVTMYMQTQVYCTQDVLSSYGVCKTIYLLGTCPPSCVITFLFLWSCNREDFNN